MGLRPTPLTQPIKPHPLGTPALDTHPSRLEQQPVGRGASHASSRGALTFSNSTFSPPCDCEGPISPLLQLTVQFSRRPTVNTVISESVQALLDDSRPVTGHLYVTGPGDGSMKSHCDLTRKVLYFTIISALQLKTSGLRLRSAQLGHERSQHASPGEEELPGHLKGSLGRTLSAPPQVQSVSLRLSLARCECWPPLPRSAKTVCIIGLSPACFLNQTPKGLSD